MNLNLFRCPCGGDFSESNDSLNCLSCIRSYPNINGIPVFLDQQEMISFFKKESIGHVYHSDMINEIIERKDFVRGLHEIYHHVSTDEFQNNYEADMFDGWDDDMTEEQNSINQKRLILLSDLARVPSAKTILDWPTGNGVCLKAFIDRIPDDASVYALDIDFPRLASLKTYFERHKKGQGVTFVVGDARHMPFRNEMFEAIVSLGGFIEVPHADRAVKESFRVLSKNGWFACDGDVFHEDSPSMSIAKGLGNDFLATQERINACMHETGFRNISSELIYEGIDTSTLPDQERCPLPARGDWFGMVEVSGQK